MDTTSDTNTDADSNSLEHTNTYSTIRLENVSERGIWVQF